MTNLSTQPDVARRRFMTGLVAGGAAAATGLTAFGSPAFAAAPAGASDALATNVKDPAYGAVGDGQTDDTAAIQRAIDATPFGGICFFPPGTYLVSGAGTSILTGRIGVSLVGAGAAVSTLKVASGSAAFIVLNLTRRSEVQVNDLGFDAAGNSAVLSAVYASAANGQRNIWVRQCRFAGFMTGSTLATSAAVYIWTTDGVYVSDSEFIDCGRAITIDQPDGGARISGNRISATDPSKMATGIWVRRSSGFSEGEVIVSDNRVTGARLDPAGVGAEGHGIAVFRCQDVRILDNHCEGNGRGILVSNQSFGAVLEGNTCVGNNDAGIRCEPDITLRDTTTGVTGARRGLTVVGNVSRDNLSNGTPTGANTGIGISLSYASGSTVAGNVVHGNSGDGIFCDSDRVSIVGNVVYNNWKKYTADPTNGKRGGIRLFTGVGCSVVGNQCFDNQPTKTQQYGLSMSGAVAHLVSNNNFSGNAAGEVFGADKVVDSFFGAAPVSRRPDPGTANAVNVSQVVNNLVKSLRELGLVT